MADRDLNEELLDELALWVSTGAILLRADEGWWQLLRSKYPAGIGMLDWAAVPGHRSNYSAVTHIPVEGIHGSVPVLQHVDEIANFLREFASAANMSASDTIIVLGDGISQQALEMSFDTLLEVFPVLFSYPEHIYLITTDAQWCFAYTFEFEMHFGRASRQ